MSMLMRNGQAKRLAPNSFVVMVIIRIIKYKLIFDWRERKQILGKGSSAFFEHQAQKMIKEARNLKALELNGPSGACDYFPHALPENLRS